MSTEAFNTMRKNLVESVTGSALDWLAYMGTDAALAAIPDTNPPRYVVAGTLADIVKLLPATEAFTVPPLTAPAPLTDELAAEVKRLHDALCFWLPQNRAGLPDAMSERIAADAYLLVGYDDMPDKQSAEELGWIAAPAPQQSESIDSIANELEDAAIPYEGDFADTVRSCVEGLRDLAAAKAAPAAPVQTAEPKRIPDMLTVETIQGAIAFGRMGINSPPSPDHWGNEFWQIGRQLAKLSETSAWDNVTPVDVAAPVQAEQAQADPSLNSKAKS
jgi:hypothetical protein